MEENEPGPVQVALNTLPMQKFRKGLFTRDESFDELRTKIGDFNREVMDVYSCNGSTKHHYEAYALDPTPGKKSLLQGAKDLHKDVVAQASEKFALFCGELDKWPQETNSGNKKLVALYDEGKVIGAQLDVAIQALDVQYNNDRRRTAQSDAVARAGQLPQRRRGRMEDPPNYASAAPRLLFEGDLPANLAELRQQELKKTPQQSASVGSRGAAQGDEAPPPYSEVARQLDGPQRRRSNSSSSNIASPAANAGYAPATQSPGAKAPQQRAQAPDSREVRLRHLQAPTAAPQQTQSVGVPTRKGTPMKL